MQGRKLPAAALEEFCLARSACQVARIARIAPKNCTRASRIRIRPAKFQSVSPGVKPARLLSLVPAAALPLLSSGWTEVFFISSLLTSLSSPAPATAAVSDCPVPESDSLHESDSGHEGMLLYICRNQCSLCMYYACICIYLHVFNLKMMVHAMDHRISCSSCHRPHTIVDLRQISVLLCTIAGTGASISFSRCGSGPTQVA